MRSQAQAAISTRFRAPSFICTLARWVFTVPTAMNNWAAISALVRPRATSERTWVSRRDRNGMSAGVVSAAFFEGYDSSILALLLPNIVCRIRAFRSAKNAAICLADA